MRIGRILAVALVATLTLASVAVAQLGPGGSFNDDDGSIHEADIEAIAAADITRGCNPPANDQFCPRDSVTRGQMAAFLVRAMNYTDDGGGNHFTDTNGHVFEGDIDRLSTAGVTRGCNPPANDEFCPDDRVTRGQMAAFLVRAMNYTDDGGGNHFTDTNGHVFEGDIDRLRTAGVTLGCNPPANDRFCPDDLVTREQMASFLTRALGLTPIQPPPPTSSTSSTSSSTTSTSLPSSGLCTGTLGAVTIDDDVIVPTGSTCTLNGTMLDENLIVRTGATAVVNGVNIGGNVQGDGHVAITVQGSSFVDGDIQAENGGTVVVKDTDLNGNIQLESNTGAITVTGNTVGGDIQVNSNTGGATISGNTVDGNLQCESNNPPPTGGSNTVAGDKEDQCSGL